MRTPRRDIVAYHEAGHAAYAWQAMLDAATTAEASSRRMLTLRMIGVNDYSVLDDGQRIGRIRFASERMPGVSLWHIQVHIPGAPSEPR